MNPNYKNLVGGAIFEFVQSLVESFAPKVTGMLIDLPVSEIQKYLVNFDLFLQGVSQAGEMLESYEASLKTATSMPAASSENSEPPQKSEGT
jgi:hypothetical protein